MKKSILAGLTTFFLLFGILLAGMFIGDEITLFERGEDDRKQVEEEKESYEPILDHEKAVIGVVDENIPAVVSVVASKYVEQIDPLLEEFFFSPHDMEAEERERVHEGTGFIISESGLILTNRHIVEDEEAEYTVFLSTGEKFDAEVLARDSIQDLAVLKIEGDDFPVVEIGESEMVRPGQTAIAIGNALGEFQDTVSVGVISGIGRRVVARGRMTMEVLDDVLQTDAAINFGNSGGPLLNLEGEVIGVNTATAMHAEGIGFAIPINNARRAIEGAKKDGRVVYPFLGVRYRMVDNELKEAQNLEVDYGALIVSGNRQQEAITPGSAAQEAGLREGDIILELENEKITANNSLARVINNYDPGDRVTLKILRDSDEKTKNATLGEME